MRYPRRRGEGIKKESSKSTKNGKRNKGGVALEESQHLQKRPAIVLITVLMMPHMKRTFQNWDEYCLHPCGVSALLVLMAIMYKRKKKEFFEGSPLQPDPAAMMMILHGRKKSIAYEGNSFFPWEVTAIMSLKRSQQLWMQQWYSTRWRAPRCGWFWCTWHAATNAIFFNEIHKFTQSQAGHTIIH